MTTKYNRTILFWRIFIFLATVETIRHGYVESMPTLDKNYFEPKLKGTVKTIEVPEDGDLIDCVDFYKQPGLKNIKDLKSIEKQMQYQNVLNKKTNPLLNKANKAKNPRRPLIQTWHKYGKCPKGTVPIRRNRKNNTRTTNPRPDNYEYAIGVQTGGVYHGVGASLNKWRPKVVGPDEYSTTQIWIKSQQQSNRNVIEAGWMVNKKIFGDIRLRFFTYWTADGYNQTGCYNEECNPSFIVTSSTFCVGCVLSPLSKYGVVEEDIYVSVTRNGITGNWILDVEYEQVGYFPNTLFTTLAQGAGQVAFGGVIVNKKIGRRHTATEMGSGHFAEEGAKRAGHVKHILILDQQSQFVDVDLNLQASKPNCYNILSGPPGTPDATHFYYGGPGYNREHCRD